MYAHILFLNITFILSSNALLINADVIYSIKYVCTGLTTITISTFSLKSPKIHLFVPNSGRDASLNEGNAGFFTFSEELTYIHDV